MAQACEICGKKPAMGNQVAKRGKPKYLGGVGTKITGITRRKFRPNLQHVRVTTAEGTTKRLRVCTQCIRSGAVAKMMRTSPFKLPALDPAEKAALEAVLAKEERKKRKKK
ncbi:MAG: 50S ribosomal protein L28 [Thermoguttaceae bacterium]|nr:50S ribosomal protein L28 [Thermoguttaceae bacterium]MDW8078391.1 50S ribosomal protein L28 [Thermoguttaceae bacterium]